MPVGFGRFCFAAFFSCFSLGQALAMEELMNTDNSSPKLYSCEIGVPVIKGRYSLPDSSEASIASILPADMKTPMAIFSRPPWGFLLQRSEQWQFWTDGACKRLMLTGLNDECYGLVSACEGENPVFHPGVDAFPKPLDIHKLQVLHPSYEYLGMYTFSPALAGTGSIESDWDFLDGDQIERDGIIPSTVPAPHSFFPADIHRSLVMGFFIGMGVESLYRSYCLLQKYRAGEDIHSDDAWKAVDRLIKAGVVSAMMSGATHTLMHNSGLWKPVSSFVVGATVRTTRFALNYWSISAEDLSWILVKSGAISGGSYLFSLGSSKLHKSIVTPGSVTGGILGDTVSNRLRIFLSMSTEPK
ncbi:hypothetical protein, partial [Parendozoicomonas sp. Alg238-R29]|uniref:hypothetical protein n=1 Tax=Parendozoicomonas sp. Alg238-R29 TaxID=2993446 RepID=UPI00248D4E44